MTNLTTTVNPPALLTMNFHGDEVVTFEADGTRYVAMRRIVENLGMSWSSQRSKLNANKRKFNCVAINTVGADAKVREMLSIPVEKLNFWLATTNPNNIVMKDKKEQAIRRAKLELYQEKSGRALYEFWTKGIAIRDDLAGIVDDISPEARKVFGGIVKGVLRAELSTTIREILPHLVAEEIAASRFGLTRDFLTAGQVLDMAKVAPKGRRGLVNKAAASLRRYCERQGQVPREAFLGNSARAYVYPVEMARHWLEDEGRELIAVWEREHGKQGHLRLVDKPKDAA